MAQQIIFGVLVLLACFCLEATSRPSNNESPTTFNIQVPIEDTIEQSDDQYEDKPLSEEETIPEQQQENSQENTQEILDKINAINAKLRKPPRQKFKFNAPLYTGGPYILDKAILEKLQQIIASGKPHGGNEDKNQHESNLEDIRGGSPRALTYVHSDLTGNALAGQPMAMMPIPYMVNMPVLVTPTPMTGYAPNGDLNSIETNAQYSTRQRPSLPFQIQWPLAPFFPVLIKDPLLHYLQGGTWQTLVDYGQNADVCNRKQKSTETAGNSDNDVTEDENENDSQLDNTMFVNPFNTGNSREGRKIKNIKKRTVSKTSSPLQILNHKYSGGKSTQAAKASTLQNLDEIKHIQNLFKKPTPKPIQKIEQQNTKNSNDDEGDLRFPFGDYTFFGNRKPVAPSPGFFINRLKVRRGGVAIAGPGGVATAGRGGTAVVGPGGLAYTQPGGLAVAGPAARVIALSQDADLNSIITRLQQQASTDGSVPRLLEAIPEGKVVATGPVVYYHPYKV